MIYTPRIDPYRLGGWPIHDSSFHSWGTCESQFYPLSFLKQLSDAGSSFDILKVEKPFMESAQCLIVKPNVVPLILSTL